MSRLLGWVTIARGLRGPKSAGRYPGIFGREPNAASFAAATIAAHPTDYGAIARAGEAL